MDGDHRGPSLVAALTASRVAVAEAARTPEQQRLAGPILAELDRAIAALDPTRTAAAQLTPLEASTPPAPDPEGAVRERERRLALSHPERVLEAVIRSSQHGVIVCDATGQITLHNVASERIWAGSATAHSVEGWGKYRAFHADGRPYEAGDWAMARSLTKGEVVNAEEVHFQRFDGTHGILLGSAAPIYGLDGVIEGAISTFADITRFKQLEAWLSITLRSIADGVIATDKQGYIEFMNVVAERITGWTMADAKERRVDELFHLVDESTREPHTGVIERVLREGIPVEVPGAALVRHRAAASGAGAPPSSDGGSEGNAVILDQSVAPIRNDAGDIQGAVLVFRDVTAKRRAEREIAHLYREAQRVNRIKDEFLATLSHELRTPLHAILGWARMLRRGKLDEAARLRAIETIERNATAQAELIEDLLDVSRIISGKFQVEARSVDLPSVVEAAIDSVRLAADAKNIELRARIEPVPQISGDPTRLQQVVWNLLSNAIKFTPNGGWVDLRLCAADSQVEIAVADSGEGIRADFLPYVFDRFRQADGTATRAHGGLGLGLAIVRHLVELHGGSVCATSDGEGRGAQFTVRLPREASPPAPSGILTGGRDGDASRTSLDRGP